MRMAFLLPSDRQHLPIFESGSAAIGGLSNSILAPALTRC